MAKIPLPPFGSLWLEPTTRWMRQLGSKVTDREALELQRALQARVDEWFSQGGADAWLFPTSAELPPRVGRYQGLGGEDTFRAVIPLGAFTAPFNVSGQPAASVPAGLSKEGLPIGVQLVTKRSQDRLLVGLAAALERALK
jgi:amidase